MKATILFKHLVAVPQRKRRVTKPRQQLASYHLTSPEHLDFIEEKNQKKPSTKTKKSKVKITKSKKKAKGVGHDENPCKICLEVWGGATDKRKDEEWVDCHKCKNWFHDSCAQSYGIFDDEYFTCKTCC